MWRQIRIFLWAAVAVAAAGYGYLLFTQDAGHGGHDAESHNAWADRPIEPGPRLTFSLTDDSGQANVTPASFGGKHLLVFYGFTHCPDICPASLASMDAALGLLGPDAERLQALFITVDPERDTPTVLRDYLASFEGRIRGLTGDAAATAQAAKDLGVYYQKRAPEADGSYVVDHVTAIFLVAPDGRYITHARYTAGPDALADMIRTHLP